MAEAIQKSTKKRSSSLAKVSKNVSNEIQKPDAKSKIEKPANLSLKKSQSATNMQTVADAPIVQKKSSKAAPMLQQQITSNVFSYMSGQLKRMKSFDDKLTKGLKNKPVRFSKSDNANANAEEVQMKLSTKQLKKPRTNEELLQKFSPNLLNVQTEIINMSLDEKRKNYKNRDKPCLTVKQIPKWSEVSDDINEYESVLTISNENASKQTKSKSSVDVSNIVSKLTYEADLGLNEIVCLHYGSVSDLEVDVIVTSIQHGLRPTDFASNIIKDGGKELGSELSYVLRYLSDDFAQFNDEFPAPPVIAFGYYLPADYIIFAYLGASEEAFKQIYLKSLDLAVSMNQKTIAFPCLGTGGFYLTDFPTNKACAIALSTVRTWLSIKGNRKKIERIIFCCFDEVSTMLYRSSLPLYFPRNVDFECKFKLSAFEGKNYIPYNFFMEKQAIFAKLKKLSFKGSLFVTDAIFWKLATLLDSNPNKPLTEINCTACIHLTDGTSYCISSSFPNLEQIYFDGCEKITERSVVVLNKKCAKLKYASFKSCSVKLVPEDIFRSGGKFEFNGCPVLFLKKLYTQKSNAIRKYKIIVIRGQNDETLIGKGDKKIRPLIEFTNQDNLNIYECEHELAHYFATPGTIFIVLSQNPHIIESTIITSMTMADGGPVLICNGKEGKNCSAVINSIKSRFVDCLRLASTEMNFVEQQMFSNLKKFEYFFKQQDFIMDATFEELKKFKNSTYGKAISYIDTNFPEQKLISKLDLNERLKTFKTENLDVFQSLEIFSQLWTLAIQGEIYIHTSNKMAYIRTSLFINCINELSKLKNIDSNGKIIPWLPEDVNSYFEFQQQKILEKLRLHEIKAEQLQDILLWDKVALKVLHPWLNDICPFPASFITSLLPANPPMKLEQYWPQFPSSQDQEIESTFILSFYPPAQLMHNIFAYCIRFGQIVFMWTNGVVLHYGCVEICIQLQVQSNLPVIIFGVRTLNLNAEKFNDVATSDFGKVMQQAEKNLKAVLVTTFQLFHQFIVTSLLNMKLFATESLKCPKCAKENKVHEIPLWSWKRLECSGKTFSPEIFGLDSYYPNTCMHRNMESCATTSFKRCVMCLERFENYADELWCSGAGNGGDQDEYDCYTCTSCMKILAIQNSTLNIEIGNRISVKKSDSDNLGLLFEMLSGPMHVGFALEDDTEILPISVSGNVLLMVGNGELLDLKSLCPNNDKIVLRRIESYENISSCKLIVPNTGYEKVFTDPEPGLINVQILFAEKPASLIVKSFEALDITMDVITVGMSLEANRVKGNSTEIGVASVKEINEIGHLFIQFKNDTNIFDYWAPITDNENLHHATFCSSKDQELLENNTASMWNAEDWLKFIEETNHMPIPLKFLHPEKNTSTPSEDISITSFEDYVLSNKFEEGMKLEALDKRSANSNQNVVATIATINDNNTAVLSYDENEDGKEDGSENDNENENGDDNENKRQRIYDLSSQEIHPIGYSSFKGMKLVSTKDDDEKFYWLAYLSQMESQPAPYHCFSQAQTEGCPKHIAYSFFEPESDPAQMKQCCEPTTMHKFNSFGSNHVFATGGHSERFTGFVTSPIEFNDDNDVLYPRRSLIHQFDDIQKQKISVILFSKISFVCFGNEHLIGDDSYEDKSLQCNLVPSTLKSIRDFLSASVVGDKESKTVKNSDSINSMHQFFANYYYEIITNLTMVTRSKLDINIADLKVLFPKLKSASLRQCAEGVHRYCLLTLSTLHTVFSSDTVPAQYVEDAGTKILNQSMIEMLASSVSPETELDKMPRSVTIGVQESKATLEQYKDPYNRILMSINANWQFADISLLLPMFAQYRALTSLNLQNSKLKVFEVDTRYLSHSLQSLLLNENPLKKIPSCIFSLRELRSLSMVSCGIRDLPDEFDRMKKLMHLNLSWNSINYIPKSLSKLILFRILAINAVKLFSPPATVTFDEFLKFGQKMCFPSFENISIDRFDEQIQATMQKCGINSFSTVPVERPEDIEKLNLFIAQECRRFESTASLKNESLGHGFPMELLLLKHMESLNLSCQHFSQVPKEISQLSRLKELVLLDCPYLQEVSEHLASIPTFSTIVLFGCRSLINPPPDTVRKGIDHVLGFFRRSLAGKVKCRRTKLMIVGLGGAGKTKFVEALTNKDELIASEDDEPEVTDGIDISSLEIDVDSETKLEYSIWDFAGQAVYYNTHQFFLSNRAIYILLWNSRLGYENSGLEFWLSSIACHATRAPVFVVATHADLISHVELPVSELQAAYPKIVHFAHVSSVTGLGMKDLMDKIVSVTLEQSYIHLNVPTIFLNLEEDISTCSSCDDSYEDSDKMVSFESVCSVAHPLGLVTASEVKEALTFLHELGSLQYFTNNILKNYVILQPQWLVDAMACLISVKATIIQEGRFNRSDINQIWSKYDPALHEWLLQLTEEFDLTFALPNDNVSIVPCMLPDIEPQIEWMDVDNKITFETKMIYKFEYLPAGLFNRTQSRLCQYSEGSKIWKNGSLLNKNHHLALVRQMRDKDLTVTVQGPRPENVLFLIHEVIETLIHDFFQGVSYDLLVPCPDCKKIGSQDPHMFSSKNVRRATELKAPFLQCSKLFHIISLQALHGTLPPSTMADYEQHMLRMVQDMNDLRSSVATDACLLCCCKNMNQPNQVCPKNLMEKFEMNKISCPIVELKDDEDMLKDFGLRISNANLLIICISSEFCESKKCNDIFTYIKQCNKTLLFAILGSTSNWKTSSIGLQIANEMYYDFQKMERFETKFQELLTRIKARMSKNVKPSHHHQVFFSYCWANSNAAVQRGHKKIDGAIGEVDPRDLAEDLIKNDIDLWVDYQLSGQGTLFEEIADALRHAILFVACVSDEYLASQNCLREFRFASAAQLTKIMCVVGKGDSWQKSEINLLALDASIYKFQIKSKGEFANLLKKINDTLKLKLPKVVQKLNSTQIDKNKPTETNFSAYRELGELAQRKILQQANFVATKLRTTDISMRNPYPRVFYIDMSDKSKNVDGKSPAVANERPQTISKSERPRTAGRTKPASDGVWAKVEFADLCFKWLCEYEGGWHVTDEPISLKPMEELFNGSLSDFLDKIATFETQMLTMLQHSAVVVDLLRQKNGEDYLNDLKQRASVFGTDGFEASYRFMYRFIRQLDSNFKRGDMQRCYLFSKKIVWLCPEHQKFSRGVLADDDLDAEEVTIEGLDAPLTPNTVPHRSDKEIFNFETGSIMDDYKIPSMSSPTQVLTDSLVVAKTARKVSIDANTLSLPKTPSSPERSQVKDSTPNSENAKRTEKIRSKTCVII